MKKQFRQAFNKLQKMGVPVFERVDHPEGFLISAEENESYQWLDYWNESPNRFEGETAHPDIQRVLSEYGLFAEWENPACMAVYDA